MSVDIQQSDRLCRVVLNRPERKNQIDPEHASLLLAALERANEDVSVGAVLLEARGELFSAGIEWETARPEHAELHVRLFSIRRRLRKPLVCAVQGPALGAGLALIANAHVAVAAQGSSFGLTDIRYGMFPYAIYEAVASALGERRATELALTGRVFAAPEAMQMGLIHEIAPAFEYDDRAEAIAGALASSSGEAILGGLAYLSTRDGHEDLLELARCSHHEALRSADLKEGVTAFGEKRSPVWPSLGSKSKV
jgi:enoyl-CoA hydratase/carnithine racemase